MTQPPEAGTIETRDKQRQVEDLDCARLSAKDAIDTCPAECERARELMREALQLMEAER